MSAAQHVRCRHRAHVATIEAAIEVRRNRQKLAVTDSTAAAHLRQRKSSRVEKVHRAGVDAIDDEAVARDAIAVTLDAADRFQQRYRPRQPSAPIDQSGRGVRWK